MICQRANLWSNRRSKRNNSFSVKRKWKHSRLVIWFRLHSLFSYGWGIAYSYLEKLTDIKDFSIILLFKAVKPRQKHENVFLLKSIHLIESKWSNKPVSFYRFLPVWKAFLTGRWPAEQDLSKLWTGQTGQNRFKDFGPVTTLTYFW
jgi:hypothetical protein